MSDTPRTNHAWELVLSTIGTNAEAKYISALSDLSQELERENAKLRELATRMAAEMREIDHEFASLQDYDAYQKEAQP